MAKDFSGQRLRGRRFSGDLRGASFRGSDLRGASFRGANLAGADFSGARLGRGGWRAWAWNLAASLAGLTSGLLSFIGLFFSYATVYQIRKVVESTRFETAINSSVLASDVWLGSLLVVGLRLPWRLRSGWGVSGAS